MTALVGSGVLLIAALAGATFVIRRRSLSLFVRTVVVAAVGYLALAFALELAATLIERSS